MDVEKDVGKLIEKVMKKDMGKLVKKWCLKGDVVELDLLVEDDGRL